MPLDSVQEFSVITSNFSAEFGRATGGIVNVATKSGTNDFHGTAYDFFRNAGLSTNTFDNKAREIEKSDFSRHQAGFSLGGPVVKDKLHFFVSTEYIRVRSETADMSLVPTAEFLARTSAATQAYFADYPLASPISGRTITAGEIAGVTPGGAFSAATLQPACLRRGDTHAAHRRRRRPPAGRLPGRRPARLEHRPQDSGLRALCMAKRRLPGRKQRQQPLPGLRHSRHHQEPQPPRLADSHRLARTSPARPSSSG